MGATLFQFCSVLNHSPAERDDLSHFREAERFLKKAYAALKKTLTLFISEA